MKFNKEIQQNFNTISNIVLILILVFGGIGYSVGFHFPNEILPGQFANGNYSFNGSLSIGSTTANGEPFWVVSGATDSNFKVDNNVGFTRIGAVNDLNNAWKTLSIEDFIYVNKTSSKVGIGTSTPVSTLDVNGVARASQVHISSSAGHRCELVTYSSTCPPGSSQLGTDNGFYLCLWCAAE